MKSKILVVLMATTLGAIFVSCNKEKDWQCECTANGDVIYQEVIPAKKGDAKDACSNYEKVYSSQNAKCKLQ